MGFTAAKMTYFTVVKWFFPEVFWEGRIDFPRKTWHCISAVWSREEGGPSATLTLATSGYLEGDAALPGCVWSEIPPRLRLKKKTKLFILLACLCCNLFQVIVFFLGGFCLPEPKAVDVVGGKAGWAGCRGVYELSLRDMQHTEGISKPLTMPSLLRSSAEKMLLVLCVLFFCFY